jgi:hypothetical protein
VWKEPVSLLDAAPTLAKLAGAPVPDRFEGEPWPRSASTPPFLFRGVAERGLLIEGHYKYIVHDGSPFRRALTGARRPLRLGREKLFDLREDPGEEHNLIDDRRTLLAFARQRMAEADPARAAVRLGFWGPSTATVRGDVICSAGDLWNAGTSGVLHRPGTNEISFSLSRLPGWVTFETWPPLSAYSLRVRVNGRSLDPARFLVSKLGLPLFEGGESWHDKFKFPWMDGTVPPPPDDGGVWGALGRAPEGETR